MEVVQFNSSVFFLFFRGKGWDDGGHGGMTFLCSK